MACTFNTSTPLVSTPKRLGLNPKLSDPDDYRSRFRVSDILHLGHGWLLRRYDCTSPTLHTLSWPPMDCDAFSAMIETDCMRYYAPYGNVLCSLLLPKF